MDTSNIIKSLEKARKALDTDFSEKELERIKTPAVKKSMERFKKHSVDTLKSDLDLAIAKVESPIHIGFLGRYSHGKTTLVNALFRLNDECKLPEGEGVVTSKVTYVSFEDIYEPRCFEVKAGEENENEISLDDLRHRVGKTNYDTSAVRYYRISLPTTGTSDVCHLFAEKRINLVDMPGLGGPYFKDNTETQRYLEDLDAVIAVISMVGIKESAMVIGYLLEELSIPVIPVLTFCDKFNDSDLYADCDGDLEKAIEKAKKILKEEIPSIRLEKVVPVSVPQNLNIDRLSTFIIDHIDPKEIAIKKSRTKLTPVMRRKLSENYSEFSSLKTKFATLTNEIDEQMNSYFNDNIEKNFDIIAEAKKKYSINKSYHAVEKEVDPCINKLYAEYKEALRTINTATDETDIKSRVDSIMREMKNNRIPSIIGSIETRIKEYAEELTEEVKSNIDNMTLASRDKQNLKNDLDETIDNFTINMDLKNSIKFSIDQRSIDDIVRDSYTKQVADLFKNIVFSSETALPSIIGLTCIILGIATSANIILYIGLILFGFAAIRVIIKQPSDKERLFKETLEKISDSLPACFDTNENKNGLKNAVKETLDELEASIENALSTQSDAYESDRRFLLKLKEKNELNTEELSSALDEAMGDIAVERKGR